MTITYTVQKGPMPDQQIIIKDNDEDQSRWFIPFDEGNRDYQEYLAWVAAGGKAAEVDLTMPTT